MSSSVTARDALNTIDQLIPLVEDAERQCKSARNASVLDVFGGGTFVDLFKHYKLRKAGGAMESVNSLLQRLNFELQNISVPGDYRMKIPGFATFADFLFDGIFVDAYMAGKIMSSLEQIRNLKQKLYTVKEQLERI